MSLETLRDAYAANLNLLITGYPGIGKTEMIKQIARENDAHLEIIIGATVDPTDIGGLPALSPDRTTYHHAAPSFVGRILKAKERGQRSILCFDEINSAPPAVQAVCHRVILEGVVGETKLPEDTWMVAAMNPVDIATNGNTLSPPLANRFLHRNVDLDDNSWIRNFPSYWGAIKTNEEGFVTYPERVGAIKEVDWAVTRSLVASYVSHRGGKNVLLTFPKEEHMRSSAWASPRTWDFASRALAIAYSRNKSFKNFPLDLVAGAVGDGAAHEFLTWVDNMDLPDPEKLLKDWSGYELPARADILFTTLTSVMGVVSAKAESEKKDAASWYKAWAFLKYLALKKNPEPPMAVISFFVKHLTHHCPSPLPNGSPAEIMFFNKLTPMLSKK